VKTYTVTITCVWPALLVVLIAVEEYRSWRARR